MQFLSMKLYINIQLIQLIPLSIKIYIYKYKKPSKSALKRNFSSGMSRGRDTTVYH